jgi:hypothetical protein
MQCLRTHKLGRVFGAAISQSSKINPGDAPKRAIAVQLMTHSGPNFARKCTAYEPLGRIKRHAPYLVPGGKLATFESERPSEQGNLQQSQQGEPSIQSTNPRR